MYTKVDDSNTDDDYHGTIGGGSNNGNTGGESGSTPDTPSQPSLSFHEMLAERGLIEVKFIYPDREVIKIVAKNSIIPYRPDMIPEDCIFLGWSTTEDLETPILRFEDHCTVYPIFRQVTDERANSTFMVDVSNGSGSHGPLYKGMNYIASHMGESGGFNNARAIVIGYSDTQGSIEPMTTVPEIGKTYYAILTIDGVDRIEPSTRSYTLYMEVLYPDRYKDETYHIEYGSGAVVDIRYADTAI